jgi:hypothetical protein
MESIAGESPSPGQLAENLSDPADADIAYGILWNVRARSWDPLGRPDPSVISGVLHLREEMSGMS